MGVVLLLIKGSKVFDSRLQASLLLDVRSRDSCLSRTSPQMSYGRVVPGTCPLQDVLLMRLLSFRPKLGDLECEVHTERGISCNLTLPNKFLDLRGIDIACYPSAVADLSKGGFQVPMIVSLRQLLKRLRPLAPIEPPAATIISRPEAFFSYSAKKSPEPCRGPKAEPGECRPWTSSPLTYPDGGKARSLSRLTDRVHATWAPHRPRDAAGSAT